jgi:hypothetical protein
MGALLGAGLLLCSVLASVAVPASAAPARPSGGGSASPSVVNFADAVRAQDPRFRPVRPQVAPRSDTGTATLPSRPTTGSRPGVKTGTGSTVRPFAAPAVAANFDGINQATGCGGCQPPDPNAATSGSEIVELVNTFIQVTDNSGNVLCNGGVTLNRLLRSTDIPVDIIPDFIPVAGYADDAIIVTLVLRSAYVGAGLDAVRAHWPGSDGGLAALSRITGLTQAYPSSRAPDPR